MGQQFVSFEEWRNHARPLLKAGVKPDTAYTALAERGDAEIGSNARTGQLTFPAALMRLLDSISCFRADGRYELMYRLAWRTSFENPKLVEDAADPDVRTATLMDSAIRRDVHKMHAFVRFREILDARDDAAYFAWFEPEHEILRRASTFFVKRFPNMNWTIATPDGAAVWNKAALNFVDSTAPEARPMSDEHEDLWRTYYRSICNVARINPAVMQREMPKKYWKNLPESAEIGILIRDGLSNFASRQNECEERGSMMTKAVKRALADLPPPGDGPQACRRCDLWRRATQAVVGEGAKDARIMLVGEQPGDEEDLRGHPFVGPAGRVLDQVLAEAGISRAEVYITNAVKHFKWEPRGRRRLHKKPSVREIDACQGWLGEELAEINSPVVVALGATALRALAGSPLPIDAARRQTLIHPSGAEIVATYHPSAILRAEGNRSAEIRDNLIADLTRAGELAAAAPR
ncbi:MAG: UdgX family uracil-DNA binding protein [Steroidobacteraceae bacterium]